MNPKDIANIKDYKKFYETLVSDILSYEYYFNKNKDTDNELKLNIKISELKEYINDIENSKGSKFAIESKTLRSNDEDRIEQEKIASMIQAKEQELRKVLAKFESQLKIVDDKRKAFEKLGRSVIETPSIANTVEAKKANEDMVNLLSSKPSLNFYEGKEISDWLKNKNELIDKADRLKAVDSLYTKASAIFEYLGYEVDKRAKDIVSDYITNRDNKTIDSIKKLEEYLSKYETIVSPAIKQVAQDKTKSDFDTVVNKYTDAKKTLESASDNEKKFRTVADALSKVDSFFSAKKSLDENKQTDVKTFINTYGDYYKNDIQKGLNELKKIPKEVLTKEEFDKKSLAGQIEYASKTGNALGKTVADVVKDVKHNLSDWQKQEILSANSKGVTPIEMASIADKIDILSKTPVSFRNSFIPKFSRIKKLREAKQDSVRDYKNLLTDMRIAIMALPVQDNVINNAVQLIDDALTKNTIEDMQKAYDVALAIQNNPDYMGKDDILRQQYDYYYADNREVPTSAQLLDIDNGRKIMQNMVNIAKAKTEQLRDIPNTAGSQKFKTDIEDKTNKSIAQTVNVINSIKQKQEQAEDTKKMDTLVSKMRKESPERNRVYKVNEQGKPELQQVIPEDKLQMKQDLSNILKDINPDIAEKYNETDAYGNMLKAYNNNDSNEFYRNYKILENIKNTEIARANFIVEYQNMIQQLNSLKAGKQDMIVLDINNAINKISELFKVGTDESMNSARDIYNEIVAVVKSKEVGANTQITPSVNQPVNNEQIIKQGETQNV